MLPLLRRGPLADGRSGEPTTAGGTQQRLDPVRYEPGESHSGLLGGNSNWRGPVWLPVNHLIIEGLRRFAAGLGPDFTIACPTAGGPQLPLDPVATELADRLVPLLLPGADGRVPAAGGEDWPKGLLWFHEYFHGDTGRGLAASHQTGWTGLLPDLVLGRGPVPGS